MTAPRSHTTKQETISLICNRALDSYEGVEVNFTVERCGSWDGAKKESRGFTQSFYAFLSNQRRRTEVYKQEVKEWGTIPRDTAARTKYDDLTCVRLPLPERAGWQVTVVRGETVMDGLDIRDIATGKPLTDIGTHKDPRIKLMERAMKQPQTITAEEWDRLTELDAAFREESKSGFPPWHVMLDFERPE